MLSNYSSSDRYGYNYKHLGSGAERRTCQCARRRVFIVAAGLISTCTIVWAVASGGLPFWRRLKEPPPGTVLPPLYAEYHEAELRLPQQNWDITEPMEGEKFFYVAGHIRGALCLFVMQCSLLIHAKGLDGETHLKSTCSAPT